MPEFFPQVKQLVQRSEQVFDPIQVPVQIGQDIYIITQQDVRRIEDTRYLSYYKYEQQPQITNKLNNFEQKANFFDENHLWDTLSTALIALRSIETNPQKVALVNGLIENLTKCRKSEFSANECQMQCESDNMYQKDSTGTCLQCNYQNSPTKKRVRFIQNVCCYSPILKNRSTETCFFIEEEQPNVREQLLRKKKASDVFN